MRPIGRRGQVADGISTMYRLFMVLVVAFAVFSLGGVFYKYNINVRGVEARILVRNVVSCLAPEGVLDLSGGMKDKLGKCGISDGKRLYVAVDVLDSSGKEISKFNRGDKGALWIHDLFGKVVTSGKAILGVRENTGDIQKYQPGYYKNSFPVFILHDGRRFSGNLSVEAFVNYDN